MVISSIVRNNPALDIIQRMHRTENDLGRNIKRLSTGLRISSSADNPGDMTTLTKLSSRIRSVDQASLNAQTAANMAATATTALSDIIIRLESIRTKAVAAANTGASEVITRAGYQAEIQQMIDEMDRIAAATTFGGKRLLDGSHESTTRLTEPDRFPGSIAFGADASSLRTGTNILSVVRTNEGSERFATGDTGGMNLGIVGQTDIAVSIGQFVYEGGGGSIAGAGVSLASLNFAEVSLKINGVIEFSGIIADGVTSFRGYYSIAEGTTVNGLVTSLQSAIDAAETTIGVNGDGTGAYETVVSYDTSTGRLEFANGQGNTYSQFSSTFAVKDSSDETQTTSGSTRATDIFNPRLGGTTSGALLGNSLTSITGSTFDTGTFEITVSDATAAQQRTLSTTYAFTDIGGTPVTGATQINNSYLFNGVSTLDLSTNDTIEFTGTNPDGTTFNGTITVESADAAVGNAEAFLFSDLIDELNHRDQTDTFYGWTNATATFVAGKIQLIDDVAATSGTAFQMVVDAGASGTAVDDGVVVYSGNAERATISIAGGEAQTVDAGSVVTLEGVESTVPGRTYQATFRVGENLFDGADDLAITAQEYVASLNSGPAVTFRNGDQGVSVTDGINPTGNVPGVQQINLDFDTVLGITADADSGGEKFAMETTANRLNFHIGPDADDYRQFAFFDVRSTNLGLSAGNSLSDINVTTLTGAEDAMEVVDAALDQLNSVNSFVGSLGSRMQDTSGNLTLYSLSLQQAETSIASTDIAKETTELLMNYILLNSQAVALAQTTLIPKNVFSLLTGQELS